MSIFRIALFFTVLMASFTACSRLSGEPNSNTAAKPSPTAGEEIVTAEQAASNALKVGDTMPSFELPDSHKETVKSEDLIKQSNLVVVFYRGGWCPFCNLYLKSLQDRIGDIKNAGGQLVAISPENPDDSLSTEQKHKLEFHVLSDSGLSFARKVGLVYQLPADTNELYKGKGIDLVVDNDMDKPELPISATYIVNQSGKIVYAFVEPDYKQRAKPDIVIEELQKLKTVN